ncbi:MAG: hypothetical protein WC765_01615 [Phycisphaerae bacterium]|jgi:hypothetical protein
MNTQFRSNSLAAFERPHPPTPARAWSWTHLPSGGWGNTICNWNTEDKAFSHITPDIARYVVDWNVSLHRVVRAVLQLADGNPLKPSETRIFPQFHKGESAAPPNSSVVI